MLVADTFADQVSFIVVELLSEQLLSFCKPSGPHPRLCEGIHEGIADERRENARIREFVISAFRDMGCEVPESHTNHIFVNLGRSASDFRAACLERRVRVGRDFPPLQEVHSRISMGTMEEMQTSVRVFREVLGA